MLGLVAAALSACATVTLPGGFKPPPPAPEARGARVEVLEVVAEPDARPFQGRTSIGKGFLIFLPLVPYGHQQISPEFGAFASSLETGSFPTDVRKVVIEDLRAAQLAGWVGAPDDRLPGIGADAPAYRLHLTVEQGIYHRKVTLYGLSIIGFALWLVGLPDSYGSAELAISAELRDPSGVSLGSERLSGHASATEWLYYPGPLAYPPAMPEAYAQISPRLRAFVGERLPAP